MTTYRCSSCGNRTRFDVESTTRSKAFHHYSLGGEVRVEDETVLERRVASVTCRWCGSGASVEAIEQVADETSPR